MRGKFGDPLNFPQFSAASPAPVSATDCHPVVLPRMSLGPKQPWRATWMAPLPPRPIRPKKTPCLAVPDLSHRARVKRVRSIPRKHPTDVGQSAQLTESHSHKGKAGQSPAITKLNNWNPSSSESLGSKLTGLAAYT